MSRLDGSQPPIVLVNWSQYFCWREILNSIRAWLATVTLYVLAALSECRSQRLGVMHGNKLAIDAVPDDTGDFADIGGDDRQTRAKSFEYADWHSLVCGRKHEDVGTLQVPSNL